MVAAPGKRNPIQKKNQPGASGTKFEQKDAKIAKRGTQKKTL